MHNFSQQEIHPKAEDARAVDWLFVVDTLNFCFWSFDDEQGWTVEGKTGYFALCAAVNRALREKVDILNPEFYSTITSAQLSQVLRSDNDVPIPLFAARIESLHEVGTVLLEKFDGSFERCIELAENSAAKLLNIVVDSFDCFRDQADYKGRRVSIYKRAQILIGDVWACFKGRGLGRFDDIDVVTMFADYRVPQSLLYHDVFAYSDELLRKLKSNEILRNGDEMEVEIRGCSIHAVELLNDHVLKRINDPQKVNSVIIDHFLWDFRRKNAKEILKLGLPFHKTHCIYY